jgi:hypothetical protein
LFLRLVVPAENNHLFVTKIPLTTCVFVHASADGKKVIFHLFNKNIALVFSIVQLISMLGPSTITVNGFVFAHQSV